LAAIPLVGMILAMIGLPIPPPTGWIAIVGAILGWRAMDTVTSRQGYWAIFLAIVTVVVFFAGIARLAANSGR
jgi:hypothetical protein